MKGVERTSLQVNSRTVYEGFCTLTQQLHNYCEIRRDLLVFALLAATVTAAVLPFLKDTVKDVWLVTEVTRAGITLPTVGLTITVSFLRIFLIVYAFRFIILWRLLGALMEVNLYQMLRACIFQYEVRARTH